MCWLCYHGFIFALFWRGGAAAAAEAEADQSFAVPGLSRRLLRIRIFSRSWQTAQPFPSRSSTRSSSPSSSACPPRRHLVKGINIIELVLAVGVDHDHEDFILLLLHDGRYRYIARWRRARAPAAKCFFFDSLSSIPKQKSRSTQVALVLLDAAISLLLPHKLLHLLVVLNQSPELLPCGY